MALTQEGQELFFSEYAEGSSNNKYLEIYNPTNQPIALGEYAFPNASNGADVDGTHDFWNIFTAGATIEAGGTYLIAHPSADPSILALADQTHQYLSNGDDGYALVKGTEGNYIVIDRIGDFGADPGSGWDVAGVSNGTKDHTLVRKSTITSGNADWDASRGTNTADSEWVVLPKDAFLEGSSEATPGRHAVSTLFFSEYAEGSSNNKYLEIYNPTNQPIALGEYAFPNASNGADGNYEFWNIFTAEAIIEAGGTYLIAHPSADPSILALADQTHQYLSNGDDGYALVKGTESNYIVIDRIGDFGADPGSGWDVAGISNATKDHTLVRKSSVFSGNTDWDASRGTNSADSEWIVLDNDAFLNQDPQATPGSFTSTAETPIVLPSESDAEKPAINTNTFISTIQGSGVASALVGEQLRIEAIVTAIHPEMKGFYVQEEDADSDNDDFTSEGLFIYDPSGLFNGAIGDLIQVTGTVSEYATNAANFTSNRNEVQNSLTQLSLITDVRILSSGNALPAMSELTLPVADIATMEAMEGMRVSVNAGQNPLTVTNNYTTGRFGQVGLSAQGRLYQYTEQNAPDVDGYSAYLSELEKTVIWLDDASTAGNPATVIHARGGDPLSASNTLRTGDTITSISGVLDQRFEGYRVQSTEPADFQPTNERTLTAPGRQGSIRVAAFNLLNFWNGDGEGNGFPTERGALSLEQYNQQLSKLLAALQGLDADIVALQELENDGFGPTSAIASLVNALNGEEGAIVYDYVRAPETALTEGRLGTDAIANGLIYRTDKVRLAPDTEIASLDLGYTRIGDDPATQSANRPVIAATFEALSSGEIFTAVSIHLKSKGSEAQGEGNADINDGQGFSNGQRSREAQAIADWLKTDPTGSGDPDVLILGDFNAYSMEDPLSRLRAEGYADLATEGNYTYQFRGQFGALDHAMASESFLSSVVNASPWHINSDEPVALVHTNYRFSPDLTVDGNLFEPYYAPDAYASSDHDPIVVDLFATGSDLFAHGVASGDPYSDSVILWTRYSAEQFPFVSGNQSVAWEISTDSDFGNIVNSGIFQTNAERDWTVKVEAIGLLPDTNYYYRFKVDDVYSETGKTKTLSLDAEQVRFAVLSCANFTNTPSFDTYARVSEINASRPYDAAVVLGDYIYEYGPNGYPQAESAVELRGFEPNREVISLDDYRQRYAQYHTDAALREMRSSVPIIAIWDDHETANDSWKGGAQNHNPDLGEGTWGDRVASAMQAYYEWMPIREPSLREGATPQSNELPLTYGYRSFDFSDLVSLHLLETRLLARDEQLAYPGATEVSARLSEIGTTPDLVAIYAAALGVEIDLNDNDAVIQFLASPALTNFVTFELVANTLSEALTDTERRLIGSEQLAWLSNEINTSNARWQVLGQQVLMQFMALPAELILNATDPNVLAKYSAPLAKLAAGIELTDEELALFDDANKVPYNLDAWDGYGAERESILQIAAAANQSLISLAGDTHNAWAGKLRAQTSAAAPAGTVVGLEFATPGTSSPGLESFFGPGLDALFTSYINDLDYANTENRGFLDLTFREEDVTAQFELQGTTDWHQDFVIGFNNPTISADPLDLEILQSLNFTQWSDTITGQILYVSTAEEANYLRSFTNWEQSDTTLTWSQPGYSTTELNDIIRLYNPNSGDHLYTINQGEVEFATQNGFITEGIVGRAFNNSIEGLSAFYRFYDPALQTHAFSTDADAFPDLIAEGIAFWN